jgi:hypothetical protein
VPLTDETVAKPPHTPRGTASNSFRRKVRERRVVTDASGCTEAKTNAHAYWSPSAPENKTGARIDKDGEKRLRLATHPPNSADCSDGIGRAEEDLMEINSPDRVNHKADSNKALICLVQYKEAPLPSDSSVHSAHSSHSKTDSLESFVRKTEQELLSLDEDKLVDTEDAQMVDAVPTQQAGLPAALARDYAAEKAAIEVDDDSLSLSVASSNKVDLSGLSSDDSSFEENEQLLQQASKSTSKPTSQSKILRFASNLPSTNKSIHQNSRR